jgi:hypothetical protein
MNYCCPFHGSHWRTNYHLCNNQRSDCKHAALHAAAIASPVSQARTLDQAVDSEDGSCWSCVLWKYYSNCCTMSICGWTLLCKLEYSWPFYLLLASCSLFFSLNKFFLNGSWSWTKETCNFSATEPVPTLCLDAGIYGRLSRVTRITDQCTR